MQGLTEAEPGLEQPGARQQDQIERPRPVLDVAFRRVDAPLAGIEPAAAVVQSEHAVEAHVGVGIGQQAVHNRGHATPGEQGLRQDQAAQRQHDQPAERRAVGERLGAG